MEIGVTGLGFSTNKVSFQYISLPKLNSVEPQSIYQNNATELLVKGTGFWNTGACRVRINGSVFVLMALTFVNSTSVKCSFPAFSDTTATYKLGVTLNGYDFTEESNELLVSVSEPIQVISLFPVAMFKTQKDVTILVEAYPIPDNVELSCIVHDFAIIGTKISSNGKDYLE